MRKYLQENNTSGGKDGEAMELTKKNMRIAKDIIRILNEYQCTVAEANDIMAFVKGQIYATTTVKATINKELLV